MRRIFDPNLNFDDTLARAVETLQKEPTYPLKDRKKGVGVKEPGAYVLYYHGDLLRCRGLKGKDGEQARYDKWEIPGPGEPIYIGKGADMRGRLGYHIRSSEHVAGPENLDADAFTFKVLRLPPGRPVFGPLMETLLIEHFIEAMRAGWTGMTPLPPTITKPLWNQEGRTGFGNNGKTPLEEGKISPWDILHPGRPYMRELAPGWTHTVIHYKTEGDALDLFGDED